jgi:hypothetical protein
MSETEKPPTKIYTYGLTLPRTNGEAFSRMLRAAHDYYNALLEIERARLRAEDEFWATKGGYLDLVAEARQLELQRFRKDDPQREAHYKRLDEVRAEVRKRRDETLLSSIEPEEARRTIRARELKAQAKELTRKLTNKELVELLDREPDCVSPRRAAQIEFARDAAARGVNPSGKLLNKKLREKGLLKITQHIDDHADAERVRARSYFKVYYGTYGLVHPAVEQAIEKAEWFPAFKRWEGEVGRVGAPVDTLKGLTVSQIHDCFEEVAGAREFKKTGGNTVLQIIPIAKEVRDRRLVSRKGEDSPYRQGMKYPNETRMRICIDSLGREGHGRKPVWVEFGMQYHRPLPEGAKIVAAWVITTQVGTRTHYKLQMQVQDESFKRPKRPCGRATIAVNFGYRSTGRVAFVLDNEGNKNELLVDKHVGRSIDLADKTRSTRDLAANKMRDALFQWRDDVGYPPVFLEGDGEVQIPHWSEDPKRARSVRKRSLGARIDALVDAREVSLSGKMHAIFETWERLRGEGALRKEDELIFGHFREWWIEDRRDIHREANQRVNARGGREIAMRTWAHEICDRAATLLVENTNYAELKLKSNRKPKEELPVEVSTEIARRRDIYAPGRQRQILEEVAKSRGVRVVRLAASGLTQRHHECGFDEPWDAAPSIRHKCARCGIVFDQDENFCVGMFERFSGALPPKPARAPKKPRNRRDLPLEDG